MASEQATGIQAPVTRPELERSTRTDETSGAPRPAAQPERRPGRRAQRARTAAIAGLGYCTGERVLTNSELEQMVETSDEWIVARTGIRERRINGPEQATSDLAVAAARQALEDAGYGPEELDCIIVGTVTPDMPFPSTACLVQRRIGALGSAAFDLGAACAGFIYALEVGAKFIETGVYDTVLVIGGETLSKITDYADRSTSVLFGDGAGAALLRPSTQGFGVLASYLGADGSGADLLKLPAGGSRLPASHDTVNRRLHYIQMNGPEVFKFAVRMMGDACLKALEIAGLDKRDVDVFVPHQANWRIIDAAARRLGVPEERVVVNISHYGNMSSGSVPVALTQAVRAGKIKRGDIVVLVAFGAGLTWGATVLRWGQDAEAPEAAT